MYEIEREESEINNLLNRVDEQIEKGGSKYRGMSYEEGIKNAILWLTGEYEDNPYEEEL